MPRRPRPPPPSRDPRECPQCGIILARPGDLSRHSKTHFDPEVKKRLSYSCPYKECKYYSLQRSNVNTHLRVHRKDRALKCLHVGADCDFATCDPGSLLRHRKRCHGYLPKARKPRGRAEPRPDQALSSTEPRAPSTAVTSPAMSYTSIFAVWSRGPAMP